MSQQILTKPQHPEYHTTFISYITPIYLKYLHITPAVVSSVTLNARNVPMSVTKVWVDKSEMREIKCYIGGMYLNVNRPLWDSRTDTGPTDASLCNGWPHLPGNSSEPTNPFLYLVSRCTWPTCTPILSFSSHQCCIGVLKRAGNQFLFYCLNVCIEHVLPLLPRCLDFLQPVLYYTLSRRNISFHE